MIGIPKRFFLYGNGSAYEGNAIAGPKNLGNVFLIHAQPTEKFAVGFAFDGYFIKIIPPRKVNGEKAYGFLFGH
jgi:hypothetical protein